MEKEEFIEATNSEIESSEGEEVPDEHRHHKLLESIQHLDNKKKLRDVQRTESSLTPSEYHVTNSGNEKVKLHELVGALQDSALNSDLKKQVNRIAKKEKVVDVPLSKIHQDRVIRNAAYTDTRKELGKWDPIIKENRLADQIQFPLIKPAVQSFTVGEVARRFKPRTPLEIEVAALLNDGDHIVPTKKILTRAEERALEAMSIEEAKKRRAELRKYRALMSYAQTKAKRRKKIKSKSYHRILRKERIKKDKIKSEQDKNDPESLNDKVELIDRARIEERMSLKHKHGSKFMKKASIYGKYNKALQLSVQEMFQKNQDLTKKVRVESDSEEEYVESDNDEQIHSSKNNPWMNPVIENSKDTCSEDNSIEKSADLDFIFDKLQSSETDKKVKKTKRKKKRKRKPKKDDESSNEDQKSSEELLTDSSDEEFDVRDPNAKIDVIENSNEDLIDSSHIRIQNITDFDGNVEKDPLQVKNQVMQIDNCKQNVKIIPNKVIVEKNINPLQLISVVEEEEDDEHLESLKEHRLTIAQAFASDDVIEEFQVEKQDIIDSEKVKDIDLTLPGWGEWGGKDLKPSKRKQKRFIVKAPEVERKDKNLTNVIISESVDHSIRKHQVNQLPFPFQSIHQFESSIRAPIGNTWNPESAFRDLIKRKVVTRNGAIIEPINKQETFKKHKQKIQGKRKIIQDNLKNTKHTKEKKSKTDDDRINFMSLS